LTRRVAKSVTSFASFAYSFVGARWAWMFRRWHSLACRAVSVLSSRQPQLFSRRSAGFSVGMWRLLRRIFSDLSLSPPVSFSNLPRFFVQEEDDGNSLFGGLGGAALPVFTNENNTHNDYTPSGSGRAEQASKVPVAPASSVSTLASPPPTSGPSRGCKDCGLTSWPLSCYA